MAKEIERKFLVSAELWVPSVSGVNITQGYLNADKNRTVRVRVEGPVGDMSTCTLTVKGENKGATRDEFEYPIPYSDASSMLDMCAFPFVDKVRYREMHNGKQWEIDVFSGQLEGLVIAEIELESEDEEFVIPDFVLREVTDDPYYYNSNLSTVVRT